MTQLLLLGGKACSEIGLTVFKYEYTDIVMVSKFCRLEPLLPQRSCHETGIVLQ